MELGKLYEEVAQNLHSGTRKAFVAFEGRDRGFRIVFLDVSSKTNPSALDSSKFYRALKELGLHRWVKPEDLKILSQSPSCVNSEMVSAVYEHYNALG